MCSISSARNRNQPEHMSKRSKTHKKNITRGKRKKCKDQSNIIVNMHTRLLGISVGQAFLEIVASARLFDVL